jgi:hypothetical protein
MVGEFGPYDDIIATPGLEILARLWFWLYVCIVVFILLNALLAIIVTGYDDATKSVDKTWRDPMLRVVNTTRMQLNFARDPMKCQLVMSTEVLMKALDLAIAAVESDDASSRGVLDLLESKFEGGAKIDFSVSGEVVGIYGVKVEECQLARLIEKQGVAAGLSRALAFNIMIRIGINECDATADALESAYGDPESKRARSQIRAFALIF